MRRKSFCPHLFHLIWRRLRIHPHAQVCEKWLFIKCRWQDSGILVENVWECIMTCMSDFPKEFVSHLAWQVLDAQGQVFCKTVLTVGVLLSSESCNIFQIWAADSKYKRYAWICDYMSVIKFCPFFSSHWASYSHYTYSSNILLEKRSTVQKPSTRRHPSNTRPKGAWPSGADLGFRPPTERIIQDGRLDSIGPGKSSMSPVGEIPSSPYVVCTCTVQYIDDLLYDTIKFYTH